MHPTEQTTKQKQFYRAPDQADGYRRPERWGAGVEYHFQEI